MKRIQQMDFGGIKTRLCNPDRNYKWTCERAEAAEKGYKEMLEWLSDNPDKTIKESGLLTPDVDEFWHLHILDTIRYRRDCLILFGKFIEHIPSYSEHYSKKKIPNAVGADCGDCCERTGTECESCE